MYIAWDADGNIIATLDELVYSDPATGEAIGMADMQTHEAIGGRMREIAEVTGAVAAGTWIEEIGAQAHDFKVELDPDWTREDPAHPMYVKALVHRHSRVKRKREVAEKRVLAALKTAQAEGHPVDLEAVLGIPTPDPVTGGDRHLRLGPDGRDAPQTDAPITEAEPPPFPLLQPTSAKS